MFKNHEIAIRLRKVNSPTTTPNDIPSVGDLDPGRISALVSMNVDQIAKYAGIGIAGTFALRTASEVLIHIAKTKIK